MTTVVTDATKLDLGKFLKSGDHIVWGQACGEPTTLIEALIAQAESIGNLSAFTATSFSGLLNVEAASKFALSSMGAMGPLRTVAAAGKLGIVPCHVGQIGAMITQGIIGCDVAFVQVSPADADGNHSYGLISDFVQTAVAKARVVIAEVNDQVPFTYADTMLPASKITCAVHVSRSPVQVPAAAISENDTAIAKIVAPYIENGSILQVGIGAVPDAILRMLGDRRDLGIHSGMIGDGLVDLAEKGVITNATKPFDTGMSVTGALIGTKRLFDFANRNNSIAMRGSTYTNNEAVLTKLPKLVTINSALEVDLTGQVNAEQSGNSYLGGTGGQIDYVRGGSRSAGGHSVIALPATAKGGKLSRIVQTLSGPVTTARSEVDIIVTEFGAAELKGQTLVERTKRLIAIAHPDFREELNKAAHEIQKRGF
jgi:acyl-CoA hydrolase